ncbi:MULTISPECIES: AMP nucleosidase [unclassified Mesorhizobium]|uniref:AMP nucleosidase n=1 Tax=unclassified Mesorhizobium TaxID=325217 RepID=UPI001FD9F541|nr:MULTISPECIES: AMP nucleosidase [unclassified Mesorhizobium]MDG4888357.1 AMP nucleosidase [Mesorhizobium sp. WSM4887]MDG4900649.1 AMP nucleosidase [Mesorhizobium sp. WSM4962]MDG4908614.1 AMP nucleosidase [Mesorhizobium sp. WSM4898]MDG4917113.1 AMP nucleosidase [Mesorhizobium sp. WSM4989]
MPEPFGRQSFDDAKKAVAALEALYDRNTKFLRDSFAKLAAGGDESRRYRAFYPQIGVTTTSFTQIDSRQAYGHMPTPGHFATTITQPKLFENYLVEQLRLIMRNHGVQVTVSESTTPIPLHFAFLEGTYVDGTAAERIRRPIRDLFDVPDLDGTDDQIANGTFEVAFGEPRPLAPFTAQRIDYSLHRMTHYTATSPQHFQNFVLFTNYQFYIDEFVARARELMESGGGGYSEFVEPGNLVTKAGAGAASEGTPPQRLPQMPAYHLKKSGHGGITMVNIGVGPSNAKTITDHIAVLRPHAWVMLGHCAGLRNTQALGDYVLAHAYVREDHVLDDDLPVWVPIPPLAEIQVALQEAVAEVTGLSGYDLKRIMRTGTVATIDNRNWELRDQRGPVQRLSQSRAIALDMESATIAANGFRFRVPYGTLLCVSDKPLHGELKLPGMATEFYKRQVAQHLTIGIRAMEKLAEMPMERLHSRKLRSFSETAFQ